MGWIWTSDIMAYTVTSVAYANTAYATIGLNEYNKQYGLQNVTDLPKIFYVILAAITFQSAIYCNPSLIPRPCPAFRRLHFGFSFAHGESLGT